MIWFRPSVGETCRCTWVQHGATETVSTYWNAFVCSAVEGRICQCQISAKYGCSVTTALWLTISPAKQLIEFPYYVISAPGAAENSQSRQTTALRGCVHSGTWTLGGRQVFGKWQRTNWTQLATVIHSGARLWPWQWFRRDSQILRFVWPVADAFQLNFRRLMSTIVDVPHR